MPTLPMPMMRPGGAGKPPPPSVLGGPSGPGGGPMVSPGTGAGQQAMAMGKIEGVMNTLFGIEEAFPAGTEEKTTLLAVLKLLNNLIRKKPEEKAPPAPPIPAVQPGGAGLPTGPLPPGAGDPLGGQPGAIPPIEGAA